MNLNALGDMACNFDSQARLTSMVGNQVGRPWCTNVAVFSRTCSNRVLFSSPGYPWPIRGQNLPTNLQSNAPKHSASDDTVCYLLPDQTGPRRIL